jgi:hypothetical protein
MATGVSGPLQVVVLAATEGSRPEPDLATVRRRALPEKIVTEKTPKLDPAISRHVPFVSNNNAISRLGGD